MNPTTRTYEGGRATTTLPRPRPGAATHPPRRQALQSRMGSRQVISIRGRRIPKQKADPRIIRFVILVITLLTLGVVGTLSLAGITTRQSYRIAALQSANTTLDNQLETLHRQVEQQEAAAQVVQQAATQHLVLPAAPGLVHVVGLTASVDAPGDPTKTLPVVDVNGNVVRTPPASSDPAKTDVVAGNLQQLPATGAPALPALAPYAPNTTDR